MAEKSFTAKDAKRLINEHRQRKKGLEHIASLAGQYQQEISAAAEKVLEKETLLILKDIPIEEINRGAPRFRVKTLRECGYQTIADVSAASVSNLASTRGVSEETARAIKRVVNELSDQARQGAKIRLSTDDKTPEATQLVTAVSKYKQYLPTEQACRRLLTLHGQKIEAALEDLAPAASGFRWFFTSKAKKQKASDAYALLGSLLSNAYGRQSQDALLTFNAISGQTGDDAWKDFEKDSIRFFNILEEIVPGAVGSDDTVYGLPEDLAREIQDEHFAPEGLLCELRRYQEWGVKYALHQERVLLGDEMGLGKTVQAIATMVSLKNAGGTHFVVVCPASVLTNWCREIGKHSGLRVIKVHGQDRQAALKQWLETGGVAVTTYETTGHFTLEKDVQFTLMVVDEAHYIKNPEAQRTKNVKALSAHAERLLFMTGTALENKVDEMIALVQILQPKVASQLQSMASLAAAPQFREKVTPVYYRRKREDVLSELPELVDNKEWCTMSREEERVYEKAVLGKHYAQARRVSWNVEDLKNSSKATRLREIVEEAEAEGRKVIVFSFFLDTIQKVTQLLGARCLNPINGAVSPQRRQEIIDEFDRAPAGTVLVAQILSGGTGLNIQSASVVILCEPQFKPSIENQAISRAYRMGQTRNVLVYRLLCENTVDEKITALLEEKQAIFDAFADESVAARESLELDDKTFGDIMKDEIDRINAKYNTAGTETGNENEQEISPAQSSFSQ